MAFDWGSLTGGVIGGGLTVLAGWIAYRGARTAAQQQIDALQAERKETDRRRLIVVKMAVRAEGQRLDKEVARTRNRLKNPYRDLIDRSSLFDGSLVIESSPLLRGEREDAALLGDTLATLEEAATTLNNYNHRIETSTVREELIQTGLELLGQLATLTDKLKEAS